MCVDGTGVNRDEFDICVGVLAGEFGRVHDICELALPVDGKASRRTLIKKDLTICTYAYLNDHPINPFCGVRRVEKVIPSLE